MTMAHRLSGYKRVVLYGAGTMAREVYSGLLKCGISVSFCVVTQKTEVFFMETIPIYALSERNDMLKDNDTIVLLAVSKLYEVEIEHTLKEFGINRWIRFSDFVVEDILEEYRDKSIEQCLDEIIEWRVIDLGCDWEKFEVIKKELKAEIEDRKVNENKIIFAIGDLTPRVLKIINALQNTKFEIKVFFYPDIEVRTICKKEFEKLRIVSKECTSREELMYHIILEHAKLVHMFSKIENTIISYILVKLRSIMPALIFDQYDIINEFYYKYPSNWMEEERFCLENADGVCNRGYELEYLGKEKGYFFRGKLLQFFDYCKNDNLVKYELKDKNDLSICYAGGVTTEKEYPNSVVVCWLELAKMCMEAQCHLHIYPARWIEELYFEYIELEKYNNYFHFHYPVSSDLLRQELSQYDYGIHPIKAGFLEQEVIAYNKKEKVIYGVTNHFYDYLDAGIPIIAASPILFVKDFAEKGVLIPWTIEEYNFDFLRANKEKYRKAVIKVQEELQIKKHICKLTKFYDDL